MDVVAKNTVSRMAPSLDLTFSVSPLSTGNGGMRPAFFNSDGLITGVLQRGQRCKVSSSFTPQFTQYDIGMPFLFRFCLIQW